MNSAFDYGNYTDFINMCSLGEICPNQPIKIMDKLGKSANYIPFLDQAVSTCQTNNKDLLSFLVDIHRKTNQNMTKISKNVPSFETKVQSVINEWPYRINTVDLFRTPEHCESFNYDSIIQCDESVKSLDKSMVDLEKLISEDSDKLYEEIKQLQKMCLECDKMLIKYNEIINLIFDDYEPHLSNILMDLSTKQKQFYIQEEDSDNNLLNLSAKRGIRSVPLQINSMFTNLVLIPNMIRKELAYYKHILEMLRGNIRKKQFILAKLLEQTPEREEKIETKNPLQSLLDLFSFDDKKEEEQVQQVQQVDQKTSNIISELINKSEEDEESEEESEEESDEEGNTLREIEDKLKTNKGTFELSFF
tara:strand:+ start:1661 stop:2746 length:1086 start_codon:yes stop_codon:yes gene_type:complete